MSSQDPYSQGNQQDPYSGGQYGGQYQQPQQQQTNYGSYGEFAPYQPVPQPTPYQQAQQPYPPIQQQPYPPIQNPGYGPQGMYPGAAYVPPVAQQGPNGGFAIAGLVLGIVSLVFFWTLYLGIPAAIVGIVLSILGRRSPQRRTMATVGLVLSILAIVFALCEIGLAIYGLSHRTS